MNIIVTLYIFLAAGFSVFAVAALALAMWRMRNPDDDPTLEIVPDEVERPEEAEDVSEVSRNCRRFGD